MWFHRKKYYTCILLLFLYECLQLEYEITLDKLISIDQIQSSINSFRKYQICLVCESKEAQWKYKKNIVTKCFLTSFHEL